MKQILIANLINAEITGNTLKLPEVQVLASTGPVIQATNSVWVKPNDKLLSETNVLVVKKDNDLFVLQWNGKFYKLLGQKTAQKTWSSSQVLNFSNEKELVDSFNLASKYMWKV